MISTVSASDLNESDIATMNEDNSVNLELDESQEVLSEPKTVTVTDKSFTGIINAIKNANDGDTIILDGTYYRGSSSFNNMLKSSIVVDKKLNIVGINDATLNNLYSNGDYSRFYKYRIFEFKSDGIFIGGITFKNGDCDGNGGAIYSNNDFSIDNCKFINNHATGCAGAIFVGKSSRISNCYFEGNSANYAGAIRFESSLTLINNTFINNHATTYGGAIDGKGSDFTVNMCNFTNCYCDDNEGGAVSLDTIENLNINNSYFDSCKSGNVGGAIRLEATVNACITNSTIINCKSNNNGGAIWIGANNNNKKCSQITIDDCKFIKNSAKGDGGAISRHECDLLNINNSYFEGNSAQWGGAVMNYQYSDGLLFNSTFKKNTATQDSGAVSGGTASQCKFSENTAVNYGGATSWLVSSDCTYEGNKAEGQGGAIYNGAAFGSKFINNSAQGKGGAVALTQYWEITSCSFINNSAQYGGAICKLTGDKIDSLITDSNFTGNHATQSGGAVCIQDVKSNILENCLFKDNYASKSGAVDYFRSSNINISDCEFINSTASDSAGSVGLWTVTSINLNDCNFTDSTSNKGGAIYWSEGQGLDIGSCNFKNCVSNDGGSYIDLNSETSNTNFVDCLFDILPQGISVSYESILSVNNLSLINGEEGILTAQLSNIFGPMIGKNINFTINGVTYSRVTNSDGLAFYNVKNLKLGENNVSVSYSGEGNYLPVSVKPSVRLNMYKGNLSVTQSGKYYQDTLLKFKLINSKDNAPIPYARIQITFSNGVSVELGVTDNNGETEYLVPFVPNTYSYVAKVIDSNVDVNTINVNNLTVNSFNGNIDVARNGRVFTVKLCDPDSGDTFKNFEVNLIFSNGESDFIKTNNNGIARFNFPYDKGTYDVLVSVNGNDYIQFKEVEMKNILIDTDYDDNQDFISGSKVTFSGNIIFDYLKSGSATMAVIGGQITKGYVINHPEAKVDIKGNIITVSNLGVGNFKLQVEISPDEHHYANVGYTNIIVNNVKTSIKVSPLTTYSKSGDVWKFRLTDSSNGRPLANMQVNLKVFTGSSYQIIPVTTNSNGEGSVAASKWSVGTHKVILTFSKGGYASSSVSSSVKVLKTTKLSFKVKSKADKTGSTLSVWVKSGKKYLNGVKLKLYVYNGKKVVKTITVVTGKYKDAKKKINKGFIAYGTNALKAGKHKIVIKPVSKKYTGSKTTKLSIKKTAKKYKKTSVVVTKGKRHVID